MSPGLPAPSIDSPASSRRGFSPAYLAGAVALFLSYFLTARLGLSIDAVSGFATPVWPPAGIALAALSLFGYRFWPGVALGAFLVNFNAGAPLLVACGMAAGNTLEALVGTYLLRRYAEFRGGLDRIRCVVGFVGLAAGLSTTISATIGVASGWLGGVIPAAAWGRTWLTWWLGDALGILIVAPLMFIWTERPRLASSPRRMLEATILLGALTGVALLVFGDWLTPTQSIFLQPYVIFPFLIWAALRFGRHGTVTTTLLVAGIAVWKTAQGEGPFSRGNVSESLLFLQGFMGVVAVTMHLFVAGYTERRRSELRTKVNYSVARILSAASNTDDAISRILASICEILAWDYGVVWRVDATDGVLRGEVEWPATPGEGGGPGSTREVTFRPGVGIAGRVWNEGRPLWIPKLAEEPGFVRTEMARSRGLQSAVGFPILIDGEVTWVMMLFSRRILETEPDLLEMMANIGSQVGQFARRRKAEEELRLAHAELEARIARRTEQLSNANQALQEEVAERKQVEASLRQLSNRLLRVQDEERRRLARGLHDSTAQSLAALSMNLAVARGGGASLDERSRLALDESEALAERCSREIRSLSYLLHPPLLEEVGLPAALRWCAEGFERRSGVSVDLEVPSDFGRLPLEVENALFRIVQECLTNVLRHSGSPTVQIALSRRAGGISLQVRDRGRGLPPEIPTRRDGVESLGVGLLGMRERVRQLGGEFRIGSSAKGTTIEVDIGLTPEGR